jgi:hypothetical protein
MAKKPPPAECEDKAEASGDPKPETPMERFKSLTRGLLNVSPDQLQEEQRRYRDSRSGKSGDASVGSRRKRK